VIVNGSIDRIDRSPSGDIEVLDYKTGKPRSQTGVEDNVQLSIYGDLAATPSEKASGWCDYTTVWGFGEEVRPDRRGLH